MPREKQNALLQQREIHGFLEQSRISEKNVARLRVLARSSHHAIADLASLVADIAQAAPYRRRRIKRLARERRDILKRMEIAGLLPPLTVDGDPDPDDIDPKAAWQEWVDLGLPDTDECYEV